MQINDAEEMQDSQNLVLQKLQQGSNRRVTFINNFTEERKKFNALKTKQAPAKKEIDEKHSLDVLEHRVRQQ